MNTDHPFSVPAADAPANAPAAAAGCAGGMPAARRAYDGADALTALLTLGLGYAFVRLILFSGAGVTLFAALFAAVALLYARRAGVRPLSRPAARGWLGYLAALALLFLLGVPAALAPFATLVLALAAVCWTLALFGARRCARLDGAFAGDLFCGLFALPFSGFFALPEALAAALRRLRRGERRGGGAVALGLLLALALVPLVLALLAAADPRFEQAFTALYGWFDDNMREIVWRMAFALPVAFYLFGLFCGARQHRGPAAAQTAAPAPARRLAFAAAGIPMAALLLIYAVFLAAQLPYFFSAFAGLLPADFTYAEYARRGFFELFRVAALNAALLCFARRRTAPGGRPRRLLCLLLCAATLLLLLTAARKLALYIGRYGITARRLWAAWGMVGIAAAVLLLAAGELCRLPLTKLLALALCGWFFVLCAVNADALAMRVNYAAYTAGQLAEFDVAQGDASACAGVLADIARTSADKTLRADARHRLQSEPDSGAGQTGVDAFAAFTLRGALAARAARAVR